MILLFVILAIAIVFHGAKGNITTFQELLLFTILFSALLLARRLADIRELFVSFAQGFIGGLEFYHEYEDPGDDIPPTANGHTRIH